MPYDPSYHAFVQPEKIRAIIRQERPDVLEIHSPYVAALACLGARDRDFGVRTFQWHSDFLDTYASVLDWSLRSRAPTLRRFLPPPHWIVRPGWGLVRAIGRRCDATLVASRHQEDKLTGHGVPRVHHLPFGLPPGERPPPDPELRARLQIRGEGEGHVLLVGVGRFAVEKRWDVVLRAVAEIGKERPLTLALFGDGPERPRLEALAGPRVRFMGFERDRVSLFRALVSADALVHGCPCETFGLSIAEALSCGLPVVVPDQGGAAELAEPGYAEQYASGDPGACALALRRLLARDPPALRRAALARAAELPTVEEQFERQVALYERLLGEKVPPRSAS